MKRILIAMAAFITAAAPALAVDRITASLSITNAAGTTNGQTITLNGNVRTWTNSVALVSAQVLTNSTATGAKTNLYKAVGLVPFSQVTEFDKGATNIDFTGASGLAMTMTLSPGWASVSYATQNVTTLTAVRVPIDGEATASQRTNIASLLVKGESDRSTNSFSESSAAMANFVGLSLAQAISGNKFFMGASNYFASAYLLNPISTNGANYGNAFSSPGAGLSSEQFGIGATAGGIQALAVGPSASASATFSTAVGNSAAALYTNSTAVGSGAFTGKDAATALGRSANATGTNATAAGFSTLASGVNSSALGATAHATHDNATAVGSGATTTAANQVMLGAPGINTVVNNFLQVLAGATFANGLTNLSLTAPTTFFAESDIAFTRKAVSSLATGVNAGVPVGTNIFVEVSGPGAAFSIAGLANGRDGKFVILLNQTTFNMTLSNESGSEPAGSATNRIHCLTGADKVVTGNSASILVYSGTLSRWIPITFGQ
jgi:hypothetical protein